MSTREPEDDSSTETRTLSAPSDTSGEPIVSPEKFHEAPLFSGRLAPCSDQKIPALEGEFTAGEAPTEREIVQRIELQNVQVIKMVMEAENGDEIIDQIRMDAGDEGHAGEGPEYWYECLFEDILVQADATDTDDIVGEIKQLRRMTQAYLTHKDSKWSEDVVPGTEVSWSDYLEALESESEREEISDLEKEPQTESTAENPLEGELKPAHDRIKDAQGLDDEDSGGDE